MNNDFLNHTIKFIEESDLIIVAPSIRKITFKEDGSHTVILNFSCGMPESKLKENALLSQMIIFTLFDVLLDSLYPESEGLSFKARYSNLPETTVIDVVTKETYRILKLIRNSMVHNRSSFNTDNEAIAINYCHRGTSFELTCKSAAIKYINSIVLSLSKNIGVNDKYFEAYILSYYYNLFDAINSFSDDIQGTLKKPVRNLNFKNHLRYRIAVGSNNHESKDELEIPEFNLHEDEHYAGIDYVVKSNDSLYIVPQERLAGLKTISQELLSEWIINDNNTFAMCT